MERCVISLLAAAAVLLTACQMGVVAGSGTVVTETRDVSGFSRVSIGGWGDVVIIQGLDEGVVVETDDNLMDYVTTEVRDGVLHLELDTRARVRLKPTRGIKYTVRAKTLSGIAVGGAGDVTCESVETDGFDITVSGAGTISIGKLVCRALSVAVSGAGDLVIAGEAETQSVAISGAGAYKADDLRSKSAVIAISGTGDARMWATDSLEVQVSGTGSVSYYGEPSVTKSVSGVGSVTALGMRGTSI